MIFIHHPTSGAVVTFLNILLIRTHIENLLLGKYLKNETLHLVLRPILENFVVVFVRLDHSP